MDYIYIDNSNLYLEGRRVSAVAQKIAPSIHAAMRDGILDHAYTISFGKLHEFLMLPRQASDQTSRDVRVAAATERRHLALCGEGGV